MPRTYSNLIPNPMSSDDLSHDGFVLLKTWYDSNIIITKMLLNNLCDTNIVRLISQALIMIDNEIEQEVSLA